MTTSSTRLPSPEGPGSVSGAPGLPGGFSDTFSSRYVDTGELRLHAVIGGRGPAPGGRDSATARREADMPKPTIVLIHGAWADASSWTAVAAELQRQDFTVLAPPNLLRGVAADAAYVASFLAQRTSGPVVLVGHSYGGFVITNAGTGGAISCSWATPGHLPGPGEQGRWHVVLGPHGGRRPGVDYRSRSPCAAGHRPPTPASAARRAAA